MQSTLMNLFESNLKSRDSSFRMKALPLQCPPTYFSEYIVMALYCTIKYIFY